MSSELDAQIANAPRNPGVYLMKGGAGEILYVGKARDLKARVRAYFSRTDSRAMIPFLVSRIRDVEFIVTETEKEALILENSLIKEHRPRYNVDFRDDKAYLAIRVNPAEPFARFQLVRRPKKDGARHFGPYPSSGAARETLRFLQTIVPFRSCRDRELKARRRPCLEYEIGRCSAPCVGRIGAEAYQGLVKDGIAFLEGREKALLGDLRLRMNSAAEDLRFEEAAAIRDRIAAIEKTVEKQRVVSMTGRNRDVFGLYRQSDLTQVSSLFVRGGRIIGQKTFPLIRLRAETGELLSSLLKRYYDGTQDIPDEVCVPEPLEDATAIAEWLSEKEGRRVCVTRPKRGESVGLLEIARRNAQSAFRTARLAADRPEVALPLMAEKLGLRKAPRRIECFDISNIGGSHAVAAMVTFVDGAPCKERYRRFRIRTVSGADDYAMMYEVLKRRYEKRENLPDLVVVDGGKGQLGVALAVMKDLAIQGVDVVGMAKERSALKTGISSPPRSPSRPGEEPAGSGESGSGCVPAPFLLSRTGPGASHGRTEDRVFLPGRKEPLFISRWPAILFLLQRIRDEAHRFAVTYYRKVKEREDLRSLLDGISGIGPARRKALLGCFGDVKSIGGATVEELQQIPGIGAERARLIREFFDGEGSRAVRGGINGSLPAPQKEGER